MIIYIPKYALVLMFLLIFYKGTIEAQGTLEQLKQKQLDFTQLLRERNELENDSTFEETLSDSEQQNSAGISQVFNGLNSL
jgi:hypothetical protein